MAIDNYKHAPENQGLRGIWNRNLGRKDLQGNSYISLFTKEAILGALAFTDKKSKEDEKPLSERPYKDTVDNKEFTPLSVALACGILAFPIGIVSGIGADIIDPTIEYDVTLSAPSEESTNQALSFSYLGNDFVLIHEGERFELYRDVGEETLSLLPQPQAATLSNSFINQFQNIDGVYFPVGFEFTQRYEDISEPLLSEDGTIFRYYGDVDQANHSIDFVTDQENLRDFFTELRATSLTANYGLSAEDSSALEEDYTFGDGWNDGFKYGLLGIYAFFILGGANATATARVNKNPVNRRRKGQKAQLS